MTKNKRFIGICTGVGLLVIGFGGAKLFVATKPVVERKRGMSSMVPVVETVPWAETTQPRYVAGLGSVIADRSVTIQPDVSGRIVAISDRLIEGGHVKKGEVLVEIEAIDYELALATAEATLMDAQADLRLEEGNQAVALHEMELIGEELKIDEANRDLMLREPQLKSAKATVKSAQAAVDKAKLNLERTKIKAPVDAVILTADADVGDYALSSSTLVTLAATDRYLIQASVPLSSLEPLPALGKKEYSVEVTLSDGTTRAAQTYKLLPDLTSVGRMAQILLSVADPFDGSGRQMLLGEMVNFRIQGEMAEGVALIPRRLLRDGDVVWMIDGENTLHVLPADVLQGYSDEVLVRVEGANGMDLVTTDISASINGMKLRRVGQRSEKKRPEGAPADKEGARK